MGKKSSSTASTSNPTSPTPLSPITTPAHPISPVSQPPRMDAPPPYDQVVSNPARRSSSISTHSTDRMHPQSQGGRAANDSGTAGGRSQRQGRTKRNMYEPKMMARREDGGCMNSGDNVDGCMNVGGGWDVGKTSGCMNVGGGPYRQTEGCMNYQSYSGCMNYQSSGGCLNYQVRDEWEGNEGCLNFRRGGGACLYAS